MQNRYQIIIFIKNPKSKPPRRDETSNMTSLVTGATLCLALTLIAALLASADR